MKSIRLGLMTIAACAVLLLLASATVVFGVQRINDLASRQEYVGDKLFGVRQVYETLQGMESSQRGFLLTGDTSYLAPYLHDSDQLGGIVARFEQLFQDDSDSAATVAEIVTLTHEKQAELTQTVDLTRKGQLDAALQIVRGNRGKTIMEQLDSKLLSIVAQQRAVRTGYLEQSRRTLRQLYLLAAAVGVLILVLVAVAIRTLSISIARLDDAQKAEEYNAMHDQLTGLPNRRYLTEWLGTALAGAQRAGRELHLLYFDLDGFKAVNDRLGHEAGDHVLQVTAGRLRSTLRGSDFVARIGGDEFVAALPDTGEPPSIAALIERLEIALNAAPLPELEDGAVSASIGAASFPKDGDSVAALLAAADHAMYELKQRRRAGRPNLDAVAAVTAVQPRQLA
ncbi:MAG TPA: diguanylate cyclase [Stellaceae bacterium]|jgi:diguanylate cyclase (GGDEF)-like protein|nr:diguanylate cyclase [Stellaceae bacterium]